MFENFMAAWIGIACGMLAGALQGLFFWREEWLGGYGSWPRRLSRLGHVSFFGLAFVNLAFALVAERIPGAGTPSGPDLAPASLLLIAGAATMPVVCYLAAWRKPMRHLFFVPVSALLGGAVWTLVLLAQR